MRKVYLEGILGKKYGEEWALAVASPSEALQAIMSQRPGMRQFIAESEGIQGYEVIVGDNGFESLDELVIQDPGMSQSYTFVPVIAGSKNSVLMMVLGVTLIAITGGFGAAFVPGFMSGAGVTVTAGVGGAAATVATTGWGTALSYLGMGLALGGAAMMLAPDVPDGNGSEKAENYLFSGPVNTVKQGQPIPLVYGRAIVGSKTVSASIFTTTSWQKISKERALVGITDFRTAGSRSGGMSGPRGVLGPGGGGGGIWVPRIGYIMAN